MAMQRLIELLEATPGRVRLLVLVLLVVPTILVATEFAYAVSLDDPFSRVMFFWLAWASITGAAYYGLYALYVLINWVFGGFTDSTDLRFFRFMKVAAFVIGMAFVAAYFRYDIVAMTSNDEHYTFMIWDRWTGKVDFDHFDAASRAPHREPRRTTREL